MALSSGFNGDDLPDPPPSISYDLCDGGLFAASCRASSFRSPNSEVEGPYIFSESILAEVSER